MRFSIITATFNSAATLRDTFESLLSQDFTDYELIVVDGASKDGTIDLIESYAPRFEGRLRWTSKPDSGIYDAMNKGIRSARGEIVGILNSDDFYSSSQLLSTLSEVFADPTIDAVYGDVRYVSSTNLSKTLRYYSSRPFRPWLMRLGFMPAHPSFYCRRECYARYGLYRTDYHIAADFELLLRFLFIHRIRTRYLPLECVTMRIGGASSSGWQSHRRIFSDHCRALRENGVYSNAFLLALRYGYKAIEVLRSRLFAPSKE